MTIDDIYSTIRNLDRYKKVFDSINRNIFYGIGTYDIIQLEYDQEGKSGINFVCPRDSENNFMYVEVNEDGIKFTKIFKGGIDYEELDLNEEDSFFQQDTVINLGFSLQEYREMHKDFMRYYNGFLKELTVHL